MAGLCSRVEKMKSPWNCIFQAQIVSIHRSSCIFIWLFSSTCFQFGFRAWSTLFLQCGLAPGLFNIYVYSETTFWLQADLSEVSSCFCSLDCILSSFSIVISALVTFEKLDIPCGWPCISHATVPCLNFALKRICAQKVIRQRLNMHRLFIFLILYAEQNER